ncbi:hypothetical protein Back2_10890 [Nocardioides baekrokdamisoli]|uniref:Antitoxin SocA-like Panacea domain-containing protein n=1 Tax=Nocardioides baekrokdamisoli TaxID=1804624 RepID=A0A3G9IET7_9ACTN|nr:hypothetical protein [Nocardioides baekrokdamisoli]BBH16802.1 hypothetical protein Back2_10890 [Nocardioides baekrokdamisoli]
MSNKPEMGIDDAIVLLLGAPGSPGSVPGRLNGITRLEKLVFLLEKETQAPEWLTEEANFEPYNFGPFSAEVYKAVDMLSAAKLVVDSGSKAASDEDTWEQRNMIGGELAGDDPYATRDFELTDRGWRYFHALAAELPDGAIEDVAGLKQRFARLPLRQLVRYVYQRYEDYTTKSIIRDDILGRRP